MHTKGGYARITTCSWNLINVRGYIHVHVYYMLTQHIELFKLPSLHV